MQKSLDERVKSFATTSSSVEHSESNISNITRADIVELNRIIEPKIKQNTAERVKSYVTMKDIIVKD